MGVNQEKIGALVTSHVNHNGETLAVKFAVINAANSGDNTVVAAVSSKRIRVLAGFFVTGGTVAVTWKSGAATAITGAMSYAENSGLILPLNQLGYFQTAQGEGLVVNLGSGTQISGSLTYIEVE